MIVKNEAGVIARAIASARPLIDFALIADTGSSDGTRDVIRDTLRRFGIPGIVIDVPWRDFAHNRTAALQALRDNHDIDYALILDADDQFVFDTAFDAAAFKSGMTAGLYNLEIHHGSIRHFRPQILSNRLAFSYRGVLHEFVEGPREGHSRATATGFHIRVGDGGARSRDPGKYRRDAAILEQALQTEQDPFLISRYTFYLAQSYRDAGQPERALATYLKRPPLGFWDQEIFISLLNAARLAEQLGHPEIDVLAAYQTAFDAAPNRAEALHGASHYCRMKGRYQDGYRFARQGVGLPIPAGALFVEPAVYEYGLLEERALNAHGAGYLDAARDATEQLLQRPCLPPDVRTRVAAAIDTARRSAGPVPITIVNIRPPDNAHSGAYQDLADTVRFGLLRAGHPVRTADRLEDCHGPGIVFGAHLADRPYQEQLPNQMIIYNTEHEQSAFMSRSYLDILQRQPVWDYSQDNAAALEQRLGKAVLHVPMGYVPEIARVRPAPREDIDVLFYGSMSGRRRAVLYQIAAAGLNVETVFGIYGAPLDALIARAKIVINIHFYHPGHFEALRIAYLLANGKAVVTECNPNETIDHDLLPGMITAPYESLAEATLSLVNDEPQRQRLGRAGQAAFAARDQAAIVLSALAATLGPGAPGPAVTDAPPRRLIIGSGKAFSGDALNLDADANWHPDIVADIQDRTLLSRSHACSRFGPACLRRGYFTVITASHILEHLGDLTAAMTNCLDLLAVNGEMHITVPYDLSYGAWQDPTHVRAFNERSWWYYCDWFWYIGWTEARFDLMRLSFGFSDVGERLKAGGMPEAEVLRTPRAVDEMHAVLRKRLLTEAERTTGRQMRGSPERT